MTKSSDFRGLFLGNIDLEKATQLKVPYVNRMAESKILHEKISGLRNVR